jgi:hypothetical protein
LRFLWFVNFMIGVFAGRLLKKDNGEVARLSA